MNDYLNSYKRVDYWDTVYSEYGRFGIYADYEAGSLSLWLKLKVVSWEIQITNLL